MNKKFFSSDISVAFLNQCARLLFALVLLPKALIDLSPSDLTNWFLMMAIVGFGQALIYGPMITSVRFLSYTDAGRPFNRFEFVGESEFAELSAHQKVLQINSIVNLTLKVFLVMALFLWACWLVAIQLYWGREDASAGVIMAVSAGSVLSVLYLISQAFQAILEGLGEVKLVQKIGVGSFTLGLVIACLLFNVDLSLVWVYTLYQLPFIFAGIMYIIFSVSRISLALKWRFNDFDVEIFQYFCAKAGRSGYTSILSAVIRQLSSFGLAAGFGQVVMAPYLIIKRIFEFIEVFCSAFLFVKNPSMSRCLSKGFRAEYKRELFSVSSVIMVFVFAASIGFFFLGESMINIFYSSDFILDGNLFLPFFGLCLVGRINQILLTSINHSNQVFEHRAISIFLVVFLVALYPALLYFGVMGVLIATFAGEILILPLIFAEARRTSLG